MAMSAEDRSKLADMADHEVIAYCGDSAAKWTWCFCEKFPDAHERGVDWDLMIGWFANAIETASTIRVRQAEQEARNAAWDQAIEACRHEQEVFGTEQYALGQPHSSHGERFACGTCIQRIEALKTAPA